MGLDSIPDFFHVETKVQINLIISASLFLLKTIFSAIPGKVRDCTGRFVSAHLDVQYSLYQRTLRQIPKMLIV